MTLNQDLRTLLGHGAIGSLSDGELLDRFLARREGPAFEEIVRRHGPMVWGVCRRILRDPHDAEDAFQATFLVFARKAGSVAHREMVARWLHGVACRTALKARRMALRRRDRERPVSQLPEAAIVPRDDHEDLRSLLDRELSRLPEKYRVPIVLCALEGKTHGEAALELGWPIGTVSGRLSRAKTMLASRLSRSGIAFTGRTLAAVLADETVSAGMPSTLAAATIEAVTVRTTGQAVLRGLVSAGAAALTEGMVKDMVLAKVGVVTVAILFMGCLAVGLAVSQDTAPTVVSPADEVRQPAPFKADRDSPREVYRLVSAVRDGRPVSARVIEDQFLFIQDGTMTFQRRDRACLATFRLGKKDRSPTIDLVVSGDGKDNVPRLGIYRQTSRTVTFCFGAPGENRPPAFESLAGSNRWLALYEPVENPPLIITGDAPRVGSLPVLRQMVDDARSIRDSLKEELDEVQDEYLQLRKSVPADDPRVQVPREKLGKKSRVYNASLDILKQAQLLLDQKEGELTLIRMVMP